MNTMEVSSMQKRVQECLDNVRTGQDPVLRAFNMGKVIAEATLLHNLKVMSDAQYMSITTLCGKVLYGN